MLAELERSAAEYRADNVRQLKSERKAVMWLARILVVPVSVLAMGMVGVVLLGLWGGHVPEISRYSSGSFYRSASPVLYWISMAYHGAIAGLLCWLSVAFVKASQWFPERRARSRRP